ncbi:hypothetical protein [Streptomyces erythrochromogenes]|uniref:hypothetical protein n=1 Tax=Streptomyces erythrochromogenes TaxID=285574 RepID=UPI0036C9D814
MHKSARSVWAGAVIALGIVGATAPNATAAVTAHPSGCHYEVPSGKWGSVAQCTQNNGGSYRANVTCKFTDGKIAEFDGPWKKTGRSFAYCQGDSRALYAGIWTKST